MNIWTDPNKTFSPHGSRSGITLILLDCPPRSIDQTRLGLIRNWRLLRAFAEVSGTPVERLRKAEQIRDLPAFREGSDGRRGDHFLIAGKAGDDVMLPIVLEAALNGIALSIVYDAFLEGRANRSDVMPIVYRRPMGTAPLYVSTRQALAAMLMQHGVDERLR